jgi:hypothetical protein
MSDTNGSGHVTKQDLRDMLGEMEARLQATLRADIDASEKRLRGDIENGETKRLTEFWKWGRVSDQRMRRVEFSDATTVERIGTLEERVFTLERKIAGSKE